MRKLILAFLSCLFLVLLSYYCLDQPLAKLIYRYNFSQLSFWKGITYLPNTLVYLSAFVLMVIFVTPKAKRSNNTFQAFIVAMALGNYVSLVLVKLLKFIFGRIGPEYWAAQHFNMQAYGFYPFHGKAALYQDFPSGHSAVMFTILAIIWHFAPQLRAGASFLSLLLMLALILTQSHYLGDCLVGAFLGSFIGYLTCRFLVQQF